MRVKGAHQVRHPLAVTRHRELQLLQIPRVNQSTDEYRVARDVSGETPDVPSWRRLPGAQPPGQRVVIGPLGPVPAAVDAERAHRTAKHGRRPEDMKSRR